MITHVDPLLYPSIETLLILLLVIHIGSRISTMAPPPGLGVFLLHLGLVFRILFFFVLVESMNQGVVSRENLQGKKTIILAIRCFFPLKIVP